jgi:CheY-like chemotaxis protein
MKKKVLIVEDAIIIAEDLAASVEELGYEMVGIADNAPEAFEIIESRKPDVALLDINLGTEIDGLDIAKKLNEEYHLPFIFITAFSSKQTQEKIENLNPKGYLVKPFENEELEAALVKALE